MPRPHPYRHGLTMFKTHVEDIQLSVTMDDFFRCLWKMSTVEEVDDKFQTFSPVVLDCILGKGETFCNGWAKESLVYYKKMIHYLAHPSNPPHASTELHSRLSCCLDIIRCNVKVWKGTFPIEIFGALQQGMTVESQLFCFGDGEFPTSLDKSLSLNEFIHDTPVFYRVIQVAAKGSTLPELNIKLSRRIGLILQSYVSRENIDVFCNGVSIEHLNEMQEYYAVNLQLLDSNCDIIAKNVTLFDGVNKGPILLMKELQENFVDQRWVFEESVKIMVRFIV
jgi:hypothetical protein